jgi:hypothetical protein
LKQQQTYIYRRCFSDAAAVAAGGEKEREKEGKRRKKKDGTPERLRERGDPS